MAIGLSGSGTAAPPKKKPVAKKPPGPTTDFTDFYGALIPKWQASGDLFKGTAAGTPVTDFDAILKNDPSRILSEKQMQENIAAAGLAREAAIKRAMLALASSEKDIARGAGFQQADLGANLAGRGMLQSGGYGAGTMRVEENRARAIAQANQVAQDVAAGAYATEADIGRQSRQGYEQWLAERAEELAKDPRYQVPDPAPANPNQPGGPPAGRMPLQEGFRYGQKGQYMTREKFQQTKPGGDYEAYIAYLRKARGGVL